MGLDNGIRIEDRDLKKSPVPKRLQDKYDSFEIAYWRKCYGIRNRIINYLRITEHYPDPDGQDTLLNKEDIHFLIAQMEQFTRRKYWEIWADSIWEFDEFKDKQKLIIKRLKWLYRYMSRHFEIEVYFYDSY